MSIKEDREKELHGFLWWNLLQLAIMVFAVGFMVLFDSENKIPFQPYGVIIILSWIIQFFGTFLWLTGGGSATYGKSFGEMFLDGMFKTSKQRFEYYDKLKSEQDERMNQGL